MIKDGLIDSFNNYHMGSYSRKCCRQNIIFQEMLKINLLLDFTKKKSKEAVSENKRFKEETIQIKSKTR